MLGNKEIFANNLRRLMKEKDVTASEVCDALGYKHNTFSYWVNAKMYPRIDKIEEMAKYFGVRKSDLVEDHDLLEQARYYDYSHEIDIFNAFGYEAYQLISIWNEMDVDAKKEILNFAKFQYSTKMGKPFEPVSKDILNIATYGISF